MAVLCVAIGCRPTVGPLPSGQRAGTAPAAGAAEVFWVGKVRFDTDVEFRRWLELGTVDFAEIFSRTAEAAL